MTNTLYNTNIRQDASSNRKSLLYCEVKGFLYFGAKKFAAYCKDKGILSDAGLRKSVCKYFRAEEREPTLFELATIDKLCMGGAVIETERIGRLSIASDSPQVFAALDLYLKLRKQSTRPISLHDIRAIYADDAKEPKKRKKVKTSEAITRPTLAIYPSVASAEGGIPSAYQIAPTLPTTIKNKSIVALFLAKANTDHRQMSELASILNEYGKALVCDFGLITTLLKLEVGCCLNAERLEALGDPVEVLFSACQNAVVAVVLPEHLDKAVHCAGCLGYSFFALGNTTKSNRLKIVDSRKTIFDIETSYLRGEHGFCYVDTVDVGMVSSLPPKNITKKSIEDAFLADGLPKYRQIDFIDIGKPAAAPLGGRLRQTPSQIMATHTQVDNRVVVTSRQDYNQKIQNSFLSAVYSVVVAYEKLIVSGATPIGIRIAENTPTITREEQRPDEFLYRLGMLYAKHNLHVGLFANEPAKSDKRAVYAGSTIEYDSLISNVFVSNQKIFRLPLKRDKYFMPDFKYLIKLFHAVSFNIASGNIVAAAVTEDNIVVEIIKSCLGEGCGLAFAKRDSGFLNPAYGDLIVAVGDISQLVGFDSEYIGITDNTGILKDTETELKLKSLYKTITATSDKTAPIEVPQAEHPTHTYGGVKKYSPKVFLPLFDVTAEFVESGFVSAGGLVGCHRLAALDNEYIKETRMHIESSDIIALSASPSKYKKGQISKFISHPVILDAINELLYRREGIIIAFGEAFYSLIELGFLPYGRYVERAAANFKISDINTAPGKISKAKIVANNSPWLAGVSLGSLFSAVTAPGERTLTVADNQLAELIDKSQICSQYVDNDGGASDSYPFNPTGNTLAIESLCSPNGRIFGSVGHNYRVSKMVNVNEKFDLDVFKNGINYYR